MKKALIAIVGNSAAFRKEAAEALRRSEYDTVSFANSRAFSLGGINVDCIICGVQSHRGGGMNLLRSLHESSAVCPFVCISQQSDVDIALLAGKLGAAAFLVEPVTGKRLVQTVAAALVERQLVVGVNDVLHERLASLTGRQRQTFELLVQGVANKDIAVRLNISVRTVEIYRAAIMAKMEASSLVDLVRLAIRLGFD